MAALTFVVKLQGTVGTPMHQLGGVGSGRDSASEKVTRKHISLASHTPFLLDCFIGTML